MTKIKTLLLAPLAFWAVFWNVENLFDWKNDGISESEASFSASGVRHWSAKKFRNKCTSIGKIILSIADSCGTTPDFVGFAEVENAGVLKAITGSPALYKLGYRHIHYESGDRRGIDCGLIYRNATPLSSGAAAIRDSSGAALRSRDILWAVFRMSEGDTLAVLVNHHPSKVGRDGGSGRTLAMDRMEALCDSLEASGVHSILSFGDFNEDVWHNGGPGTIKYHGSWEKIDGCFSRNLSVKESVWDSPALLEKDRKFGGMKPRRTYVGLKYNGGISDHLPIVLNLQ